MEISPRSQIRQLLDSDEVPDFHRSEGNEIDDMTMLRPHGDEFILSRRHVVDLDGYEDSQDQIGETQPSSFLEPIGEEEVEYDRFNPPQYYMCNCEEIISQFKSEIGPLGTRLIEAIDEMEITDSRYSIHNLGMLMYHLVSYFTLKRAQMGENVLTKVFNMDELNYKFSNSDYHRTKVDKLIRQLPTFSEIKEELGRIFKKAKEEQNRPLEEQNNFSMLKPNDHVYQLFSLKVILECYYMYYTTFSDLKNKTLKKKILPLMLKFYKTCDKIDRNLVCDMNEIYKKVTTTSVLAQLRKLGCLAFHITSKIPDSYYAKYEKQLEKARAVEKLCSKSQIYA